MLKNQVLVATLVAITSSHPAHAQAVDTTYQDFVRLQASSRADANLKSYLQGIALAILTDYECDEVSERVLKQPSAIVDELLKFSKTEWGAYYLAYDFGIAGQSGKMTVGSVMHKVFTQHSRCKLATRKREQLPR
jgi:hypothetical protein